MQRSRILGVVGDVSDLRPGSVSYAQTKVSDVVESLLTKLSLSGCWTENWTTGRERRLAYMLFSEAS
jgi:hypothetical protein